MVAVVSQVSAADVIPQLEIGHVDLEAQLPVIHNIIDFHTLICEGFLFNTYLLVSDVHLMSLHVKCLSNLLLKLLMSLLLMSLFHFPQNTSMTYL